MKLTKKRAAHQRDETKVYLVRLKKDGEERDKFFPALSDEDAANIITSYSGFEGEVLRLAEVKGGELREFWW